MSARFSGYLPGRSVGAEGVRMAFGGAGRGGECRQQRREAIRGSKGGEGSAVHGVSAWAGEQELVLGHMAVDAKRTEIPALPKLRDLLDSRGTTVRRDARGCQKELAAGIRPKQAAYVWAVPEHRPTLYEDLQDDGEGMGSGRRGELPEDSGETGEEGGHGRREKRELRTVTDLSWLEGNREWKDLRIIIQLRRYRRLRKSPRKRSGSISAAGREMCGTCMSVSGGSGQERTGCRGGWMCSLGRMPVG